MFLESSRYFTIKTTDTSKDKQSINAVKLRRLPSIEGTPFLVKSNDRLDIMAQRKYENPTMFWHIADANTELYANDLVKKTGRIIKVPES